MLKLPNRNNKIAQKIIQKYYIRVMDRPGETCLRTPLKTQIFGHHPAGLMKTVQLNREYF